MGDNYAIQGIGYPMMSPLGTLGLGGAGTYSSYDYYMPSMMGMNGSLFSSGLGYGMGAMNPYTSMLSYPLYMAQMQEMMEARQADHTAYMHAKTKQNEVQAEKDTVSAMVQKLMVQGDIQEQIVNLYSMVRKGDQNGVCEEYDKLKNYVYSEFSKEFAAKGEQGNARALANHIIEAMYTNIVSQIARGDGNLVRDIEKYGDGARMNGFMKGFHRDHHTMYVDETINHIKGTRIDNRGDHEIKQVFYEGVGRTASVGWKGLIGMGVGAGAYVGLGGAASVIKKLCGGNFIKPSMKHLGWAAVAGLAIGAAIDIGSQIFSSKRHSAA